jgi:CubicO group peptidase (beta-lactamase class C family)
VLGALIESISGQSYESFLRQNIFQPLGMKDSGYDPNAALIKISVTLTKSSRATIVIG